MPVDPTKIICEILGTPANQMREPVNMGYQCPYINSECIKRSHRFEDPYPVCTVYRRGKANTIEPVCICPKRFFAVDIVNDVVTNCWVGEPPRNLVRAHEVRMTGFGTVDFVVADYVNGKVKDFISIEIQAIDITGSCEPAYSAILNNQFLQKKPTFNLNYANVRKRYISQLILKGYYHHHWGTKIVAILQNIIYDRIKKDLEFPEIKLEDSNIVFLLYKYVDAPELGDGYLKLEVDRVVGTNHNNLMMSILYKTPPSKDEFCNRIIKQLGKHS